MILTQVYLSEKQQRALDDLAARCGKTKSHLIREAIDEMIGRSSKAYRLAVLERAAGIWKDRDDLPDFEDHRRSWDRDKDLFPHQTTEDKRNT